MGELGDEMRCPQWCRGDLEQRRLQVRQVLGRERRRDGLHVFKTQPGDAGDNPRQSSVKLSDEDARRLARLPELGCLLSRL